MNDKTRSAVDPVLEQRGPAATDGDRGEAALAAAGDAAAFERLYRRHVGRIYSLARRMLGADEAEDATQDVFIRAWQNLGKFRGDSAFGTWLYRLGVNVLLARRATQVKLHARFTADDDVGTAARATPPRRVDLSVDFDAALDRLPAGARQVFVLYDVEGYTHEEIAGMLQISAGTSKSQLHRARMMLREQLT